MTIKIYNTLTNRKEEFKPQKEKFVSMYVCGITPYDEMHLGHARSYVVFDVIKRHLLKRGYVIKHVQNFTDIDDKIIKTSYEKNMFPSELTDIYINDYFIQIEKLNILRADKYPRVTDNIDKIICFINELIKNGFAYESNGSVYFSVEKFKDYGKLSKRSIVDLKSTINRVNNVDFGKRAILDFVLWKKMKNNEPNEAIWESPWSSGRPGWHIECSAMSFELLGETIDIHGGGQDLIFPHHENEIAQSEARNNKQFVKYWIHNGFVTINREKMSKSLNNFFSLNSVFKKYSPRVVRYYLLSQNYLNPLNFSENGIENAKNTIDGIDEFYTKLVSSIANMTAKKIWQIEKNIIDKDLIVLQKNFLSALDDNFNLQIALSYLHELKNITLRDFFCVNTDRLYQLKVLFEDFAEVSLGITLPKVQYSDAAESELLHNLLNKRNEARKNKNWTESDKLRRLIYNKGYRIIDNKNGNSILVKKT
ncbi:MAG: cysteine--tRNA ligase [Endomicrobium sp.]|jgi:cysteinyl-tRNA synthetase|nr:cysteine--tRNA ligase [Endomicrobium sp.]